MRLEYNNSKISPLADKQAAEGEILRKSVTVEKSEKISGRRLNLLWKFHKTSETEHKSADDFCAECKRGQ